jgi:hypothetical protein
VTLVESSGSNPNFERIFVEAQLAGKFILHWLDGEDGEDESCSVKRALV